MASTNESGTNVGKKERIASLVGGSALALYGLSRRSPAGVAVALLGGVLAYRGVSGHCPAYAAAEKNSNTGGNDQAKDKNATDKDAPGHGGVLVTKFITIDKSPEEVYAFWRKLENLPQFMRHLESVEQTSDTHSKWVAKAPAGTHVSWEAEIVRDEPGEVIAWRSTEGSTIPNSGSVRFAPAPAGRGTELKVNLEYQPPAGIVGVTIAKLFGEEPQVQVEDDLKRFKQIMETGEVTTNGREGKDEQTS